MAHSGNLGLLGSLRLPPSSAMQVHADTRWGLGFRGCSAFEGFFGFSV